jgi:cytoskeletal protein RodZ
LDPNAKDLSAFASALRETRCVRSLTIDDVAKALLLSDKQILGLESDDLSYFYSRNYAERAALSYATLLGVDVALPGAPPYQAPEQASSYKTVLLDHDVKKQSSFSRISAPSIAIGIVLLAIAFIAATFFSEPTRQEQTESGVTTESTLEENEIVELADVPESSLPQQEDPVIDDNVSVESDSLPVTKSEPPVVPMVQNEVSEIAATVETRSNASDKSSRFFIVITRRTVITAKDAGGVTILSGEQATTRGRRVTGTPPFSIEVGDPDAVEVYYLGSRIRPGRTDIEGIRMMSK